MRTLFILRHAKSGHDEPVSDKERTLTSRGRKDARRMGELARERNLLCERVLCSTATRARETLELFAEGAELGASRVFLDELYLAEPDAIVRAVREHAGSTERVMIVGHNPGLEGVVAHLTAERVELSTGAFVECTLPIDAWSDLNLETAGSLRSTFRPKDER
ncbi:MAG TPA: histidine phosphatase family protein [Polyangiaceae bacterium]